MCILKKKLTRNFIVFFVKSAACYEDPDSHFTMFQGMNIANHEMAGGKDINKKEGKKFCLKREYSILAGL